MSHSQARSPDRGSGAPRPRIWTSQGTTPYEDYVQADVLTHLQHPLSDDPGEMVFLVTTQVMELWFTVIVHEWQTAAQALREDDLPAALAALKRSTYELESLNASWKPLAHLTPGQFNSYRSALGEGSGFQSAMYRRMEFLLGEKSASMLVPHRGAPRVHAELEKALHEPSLYDEVLRLLARRGHADPGRRPGPRPRPLRYEPSPEVEARVAGDLLRRRASDELVRLGEALTEVAELVWRWRNDHLVATRRAMGAKTGTGGSAGVAWLEKRARRTSSPSCGRRAAMSDATLCTDAADLTDEAATLDAADELAAPARRRSPSTTPSTSTATRSARCRAPSPPGWRTSWPREWGQLRIRSWEESGWWTAPERIGDRIAPLVGAAPGQVVVGDSTSVNVFKAVVAAVRIGRERGADRDEILVDAATFPTDGYIAESAARHDRLHACAPWRRREVPAAVGPRTAAALVNHVDYRTGRLHDLPGTDGRRARGGRARGLGPVPQRGRPAGGPRRARRRPRGRLHVQVPQRRPGRTGVPVRTRASCQPRFDSPLPGWNSHADPFGMDPAYAPADGAAPRPRRHARHPLHAGPGGRAGGLGRRLDRGGTGQEPGPDGLLPGVRRGVRTAGARRVASPRPPTRSAAARSRCAARTPVR